MPWHLGLRDPLSWPRKPCWIWMGGKNGPRKKKGRIIQPGGYGYVRKGKKVIRVHIATYELLRGAIDQILLRHSCDITQCCNPWHLTPGTYSENMQDQWDRGRRNNTSANIARVDDEIPLPF